MTEPECSSILGAGWESKIYNKITAPGSRQRDQLFERGITPDQCAKLIGMPIPVPLAERKTDNLCKEFKPFVAGDFTASFKSGEISEEIQKRKVSLEACMKMAGLTPPKPLSAYDLKSICNFSDFDAVIVKERKRRKISSLDCKIIRGMVFKDQDYLSATPSKRVTPFLSDLDLCRFLKYKTPPHLTGESKKRGLRCNRLLSLDALDRSVN